MKYLKEVYNFAVERFHERQAVEVAVEKLHLRASADTIIEMFLKATPVTLSPDIWAKLENSSSCNVHSYEDARWQLTMDNSERDFDRVYDEVKAGQWFAPLVVQYLDDTPEHRAHYYLVAGNLRLMAAGALGIPPRVKVVGTLFMKPEPTANHGTEDAPVPRR